MKIFDNYQEFLENCENISSNYAILSDVIIKDIHGKLEYFEINKKFLYYKQHENIHNDVTFIIQGLKRDETTFIKFICRLLTFGKVILSTWDYFNEKIITNLIMKNKINNSQNVYKQIYTTWSGLKKCTTKYAIKVRADEFYDDFTYFINHMKQNPDKIITHNMFFRQIKVYPYHISDHVIGGTTENLYSMFYSCKYMLEHKQLLPKIPNVIQHCPEQWLTIAYLKNIYKEEELYTEIKNKMIKHFDIVPVEKFKDFMLLYTRNKTKHVINGVRDIRKTNNVFNVNRIKDI
jgi:hypothetical protein